MWGSSIVGFGSYHYRYESGREGDMCLLGFSSRKNDISIYGLACAPNHKDLVPKLGKHKARRGCSDIPKHSDVELEERVKLVGGAAPEKFSMLVEAYWLRGGFWAFYRWFTFHRLNLVSSHP